jgi:YD repeat-containing protein
MCRINCHFENSSFDYSYTDTAHIDAPTSYGSTGNMNSYRYDAAGNQTQGTVLGTTQNRTYDAENRLSSIMTGTTTLDFVYDANGKRVVQNVTIGLGFPKRTLYVGNLYEEEISNASHPYTVYYLLVAKMVGLRRGNQSADNGQYRMVTDQLGSTSLMVNASSPPSAVQRQYYKPYGEIAFQSGSSLTSVGCRASDGGSTA